MNILLKISPDVLYLLEFFAFFMGLGIFFILVYWIQYKIKLWKRARQWKKAVLALKIEITNENLYNIKYCWLQKAIHDYEVNRDNYTYLATQLLILYGMKYHNEEKSRVLTDAFNINFARFKEDNRVSDNDINEFGADQLDFDECEKRLRISNEASKI
jgi:hypothetical protein